MELSSWFFCFFCLLLATDIVHIYIGNILVAIQNKGKFGGIGTIYEKPSDVYQFENHCFLPQNSNIFLCPYCKLLCYNRNDVCRHLYDCSYIKIELDTDLTNSIKFMIKESLKQTKDISLGFKSIKISLTKSIYEKLLTIKTWKLFRNKYQIIWITDKYFTCIEKAIAAMGLQETDISRYHGDYVVGQTVRMMTQKSNPAKYDRIVLKIFENVIKEKTHMGNQETRGYFLTLRFPVIQIGNNVSPEQAIRKSKRHKEFGNSDSSLTMDATSSGSYQNESSQSESTAELMDDDFETSVT